MYGLPELHREELRGAHFASGVGCNATACNLALLPLVKAGLIAFEVIPLKPYPGLARLFGGAG